jgi:transposase InsO family protein
MEDIIDLNGDIYVLLSFLEKYGVNRQTVTNGMSKYRNKKSIYFVNIPHPGDKRLKWIKYSSITASLFRNHKLPSEIELANSLRNNVKDEVSDVIKLKLDAAYNDGYRLFQKHFASVFSESDLVVSHAKTMSLFDAIKQLRQFDIPLYKSFRIYCDYDDIVFRTDSIRVFYDKFRSFTRDGHHALIHGALGKSKLKKLSQNHVDEIIRLFKNPKQFSGWVIHEKLNEWAVLNGQSKVSLTSVKTVLADPYIQNQCRPIRNGLAWKQLYFDPWKLRIHPTENGEVWQLDGSRFQFPYYDGSKTTFLNLIVVFEVHSRKIIGYSMSKVEDHNAILSALQSAIENVKYIPSQLVIDNASAFNHIKFQRVEEYFNLLGSIIRRHRPKNPRDKGHAERFFNTFQTTVCRGKEGYIGEGIKSKNIDARPRQDIVLSAFQKQKMPKTEDLKKLCKELIIEYNAKEIGGRPSPKTAYSVAKLSKGAIQIGENHIALMFWDRVTDYHVRNSMILLSEGSFRNKLFQYIIQDEELKLRLNGTQIIVCYRKNDRSMIKMFTTSEKFLGDVQFSEPISMIQPNRQFDPQKASRSLKRSMYLNYPSEKIRKLNSEQSNLGGFSTEEKHQLYKEPASLEVILIKDKNNE